MESNILLDLYKKYEGCYCEVAVNNWRGIKKLFWHRGLVKRVDAPRGLHLDRGDGVVEIFPLSVIRRIKIVGRR